MAAELKPYPGYRDSGVEWLGAVPAHWEVLKLRQVVRRHAERERADLPLLSVVREQGVILRDTTSSDENHNYIPDDLSNYKVVRAGQFVMNKMKAWQGSYGVSCHDGIVSPAYFVFDVFGLRGDFFHVAIRSRAYVPTFTRASDGVRIGQWDLAEARMRDIQFLVPPGSEQAAIVRFLDHADRRIRRYIRAKQKLIALLEEQKQAVIHEAVTGRIDVRTGRPYPAYQDSAVARLGRVPAHWGVRRLKSLVKRIDQGVSPQAENSAADGNSWGVLKAGCVNGGVFRDSEHKRLPPAFVFDAALTVRLGDVLVSRASGSPRFVGSVGRVSALKYRLILSDKTFRPVFTDEADPDFMVLAMNAPYYRQQVEGAISGAEGLPNNLPLSSLRAFRFGIPTIDEQRDVVRYVTTICSDKLGGALSRAQHEVSLLKEYRTRLIADVVTGKLDVREAALRLPALDSVASGANWDDDLRRHAGSAARGTAAQRAPLPDVGDAEQSVAAGEVVDDG